MIIAQISDTHIVQDTNDADRRIEDLAITIADINALDPAPDLIVHTGDIVHNGRREEYALAVSQLAKAHAPVYVAAGNKDNRANLREAFSADGYLAADSEFIDYAVDDYPVRVIVLDTLSSSSNRGDFCAARAARFVDLINTDATKPVAVFTHHPPFLVAVGPDPLNFESAEAMSRLQQSLQEPRRVIAVFSGHVHRPAAGHIGNIRASVMPCIATALRKGDYPAHMKRRPLYHVHRFHPTCGFVSETRIVGRTPPTSESVLPRRERPLSPNP